MPCSASRRIQCLYCLRWDDTLRVFGLLLFQIVLVILVHPVDYLGGARIRWKMWVHHKLRSRFGAKCAKSLCFGRMSHATIRSDKQFFEELNMSL